MNRKRLCGLTSYARRFAGAALAIVALAAFSGSPLLAQTTPNYEKLVEPNNARDFVKALSAIPSRLTGTPGCDKAAEIVRKAFQSAGLEDMLNDVPHLPVAVFRHRGNHLRKRSDLFCRCAAEHSGVGFAAGVEQ